ARLVNEISKLFRFAETLSSRVNALTVSERGAQTKRRRNRAFCAHSSGLSALERGLCIADSTRRRPPAISPVMVLRAASSAFIPPCLPSPAQRPPSGPGWIHEIKHDGFRLMVRRDVSGVRLLTRNGKDWTGASPPSSTPPRGSKRAGA